MKPLHSPSLALTATTMTSYSLLPLALCFLAFFHSCAAQIEPQVTSRESREQEKQRRFQQNECRIERLNALEPARRIQSEAGVTEIWDENDDQFQCAGVVAIRHRIRERGLLLPAYSNGPKLIYVVQGCGVQGAAIPGCPETYESMEPSRERRQSSRDQHQKVRHIREGDVIALPAGVADWIYNKGQSDLVLVMIIDTSNPANQLDQDFRKFFLAGNPQQELQSRRGESRGSRYEEERTRRGQQDRKRNLFNGFEDRLLAEAFNIDTQLARRMKNEDDQRGIIVTVKGELEVLSPQQSREEEEYERGQGGGRYDANGIEETFCAARMKQNINDPLRADVYNPRAGRITTLNSLNLPILKCLGLSAQRGILYKNAVMTPHWNINAHSVCYFTRGRGRVQIVDDRGETVFDGQVKEGQILTAPQNFVAIKKASNEGLEWVSFKTNDHAKISQLAGRVSAMRAMPEEVIANAYQISRQDARRIKSNREEVTLFTPGSRSSPY